MTRDYSKHKYLKHTLK